jgi:hypothetical protein
MNLHDKSHHIILVIMDVYDMVWFVM